MIFHHTLDVQILNADNGVVFDEFGRCLLHCVATLVGNLLVEFCHSHSCFVAVFAALCFSSQPPHRTFQPLFRFLQILRILVLLSIAGDRQLLHA